MTQLDSMIILESSFGVLLMQMAEEEVRHLVINEARSQEEFATVLQRRYPGRRGLSSRSVRWFRRASDITRRTEIQDDELDTVVGRQVEAVGHSYGRRTMQGLLASHGIRITYIRMGRSLGRVAPQARVMRTSVRHGLMNPMPYATQFGRKLHCDQNEKLVPDMALRTFLPLTVEPEGRGICHNSHEKCGG